MDRASSCSSSAVHEMLLSGVVHIAGADAGAFG